jgi:hypothetical protein
MGYIPFLYSYLHAKLTEHSKKDILKIWEFREILGQVMKIKKNNSTIVLKELEKMGLVNYDKETETIRVL